MEHAVRLDGMVSGFHVAEEHIDCMCGKELWKADKRTGELLCHKAVFEREGLSRKLMAEGGQIFIYDFCTFYVFAQEDYALLGKWRLGSDLSSDICGMTVDKDAAYCSIRNGKIVKLDRRSFSLEEFPVSGSSMWSLEPYGRHLVCGTVDGRLLLLDKEALSIEKELALGKKNIASLYPDGEALYAASQEGKLFRIGMRDFAPEALAKNVHKKMFRCAGVYQDMVATVSYPCSEIALWDKNTLEKRGLIPFPLRLSGQACIEDGYLYISSRSIMGIDRIRLSEQLKQSR